MFIKILLSLCVPAFLSATTIYYTPEGRPDYKKINEEMMKEQIQNEEIVCDCLGKYFLTTFVPESEQYNFRCESCGADGFIYDGQLFFQVKDESN